MKALRIPPMGLVEVIEPAAPDDDDDDAAAFLAGLHAAIGCASVQLASPPARAPNSELVAVPEAPLTGSRAATRTYCHIPSNRRSRSSREPAAPTR